MFDVGDKMPAAGRSRVNRAGGTILGGRVGGQAVEFGIRR